MSGLRTVDSSQIEVARSLGLTLPQIFKRVVFPQVEERHDCGQPCYDPTNKQHVHHYENEHYIIEMDLII